MPSVRARHLKTKLELLGLRTGGGAALAQLDPAVPRAVVSAHGSDWLAVELDLAITRSVRDVLGAELSAALWSDVMLAELAGLLFGPLARAARGMRGWRDERWPELLDRGWPLAFRGCGHWAVRSGGPCVHELRLEGLPGPCLADPIWLEAVASALSAIPAFLRREGAIRLCGTEPSATVLYRWSRAAPRPNGSSRLAIT